MNEQAGGLVLPPDACRALFDELPGCRGLDEACTLVERVRHRLLGDGLLTVNLNVTAADAEADVIELQRIWSSRPDCYPVSGRKRKQLTPWTRQLLLRGELFVGEGDAALQAVFDDHRLISAMGLRAVVNVPLRDPADGRCFATFNVLGCRTQWSAGEIAQIRLLAALAWPAAARHAGLAGPLDRNRTCI